MELGVFCLSVFFFLGARAEAEDGSALPLATVVAKPHWAAVDHIMNSCREKMRLIALTLLNVDSRSLNRGSLLWFSL